MYYHVLVCMANLCLLPHSISGCSPATLWLLFCRALPFLEQPSSSACHSCATLPASRHCRLFAGRMPNAHGYAAYHLYLNTIPLGFAMPAFCCGSVCRDHIHVTPIPFNAAPLPRKTALSAGRQNCHSVPRSACSLYAIRMVAVLLLLAIAQRTGRPCAPSPHTSRRLSRIVEQNLRSALPFCLAGIPDVGTSFLPRLSFTAVWRHLTLLLVRHNRHLTRR